MDRVLLFLLGCANLVSLAYAAFAAIRFKRKKKSLNLAAVENRPLIAPEKLAILKPGDTVFLMLPMLELSRGQRAELMLSIHKLAESERARGINFVAVPDVGQKGIVVSHHIGQQAPVSAAPSPCSHCGQPIGDAIDKVAVATRLGEMDPYARAYYCPECGQRAPSWKCPPFLTER